MRKAILTACALALGGCHSNSLSDPAHTTTWANAASAVGVYSSVADPVAFAYGQSPFPDAACPITHDDGTTVTLTGGCTDKGEQRYVGSASLVRTAGGGLAATFDHYGHDADLSQVPHLSGTSDVHETTPTDHTFDASYTVEGGVTTQITYSGSVTGTFGVPTVWNGSGTVRRDGIVAPQGSVSATTTDERLDDSVCTGQAVSGTTTLRVGDDVAVITYDGVTGCTSAHPARWTLDGVDRGTLDGITCSMLPGRPARGAPVVATLAFAALALLRRRGDAVIQRRAGGT
jgi:hypothetical protein